MKCLILAAGYATRLYPLTENFPKPLLTVGDKTILDWLIDDIDTANLVDEYILISNHKFAEVYLYGIKYFLHAILKCKNVKKYFTNKL